MPKVKSADTIKAERTEKELMQYLADCLAQSTFVDSPFFIKRGNKFVEVSVRESLELLTTSIGKATFMTFMSGVNDSVDQVNAVKYAIMVLGDMNLKLRQIFDSNVDELLAGRGNRNLTGVTKIRGKSDKPEVVEAEDNRTPEEIALAKVAQITLR